MRVQAARHRLSRSAISVVLALVAVAALYPIAYMATNAFKSRAEFAVSPYGFPANPSLDNFLRLAENANLFGAVANSLFVVAVTVIGTTLLAALASFPLARVPFVGSRVVFAAIVGLILIPGQVLLVPIYLIFSRVGLVGNYLSLIGIYMAMSLPFSVFLLTKEACKR